MPPLNSPAPSGPAPAPHDRFKNLALDLPGLGKLWLTVPLKQGPETSIYRTTSPGIVAKIFDLDCPKADEVAYGPYMSFSLELANFEDVQHLDDLRPFLPTFHGANIDYPRKFAFILMEFLDGQDLQSWCNDASNNGYEGDWELDFKRAIFQTLHVMTRFHRHGIVVIDFKPDNVMRLPQRGIKFVDFGAFLTPRHQSEPEKYVYSATPEYAELVIDTSNIQGGSPPTETSDIFATGVALFELATGTSRLEIAPDTALEILSNPSIYRFWDTQIHDLWKSYPHLQTLLPLVETQLKEQRLLFADFWQVLKGYLAAKYEDWDSMSTEQHNQILLETGTTFIAGHLPASLSWLATPIAHATTLRGLRIPSVHDLMRQLADPLPETLITEIESRNQCIQNLRDSQLPTHFLADLNTWDVRQAPASADAAWGLSAPLAWAQATDNAPFTFLKTVTTDPDGHRFLRIVGDNEADLINDARQTLAHVRDDHLAWIL